MAGSKITSINNKGKVAPTAGHYLLIVDALDLNSTPPTPVSIAVDISPLDSEDVTALKGAIDTAFSVAGVSAPDYTL